MASKENDESQDGGAGNEEDDAAKGKSKKSSRGSGKARYAMDIFNEEVMENAYYTCHNIMDVLKCRGFPWPNAAKKKRGKS